jgi:ribosomal protein S6--L-glutamate ligase
VILSFHPHIKGDINLRLSINGLFSDYETDLMARADLTVVPQKIKSHQYRFCQKYAVRLFPDYRYRFGFEGKYQNIELFRLFNAPHPPTKLYPSVSAFVREHFEKGVPHFPFPFVLKSDTGGGGWGVFLACDKKRLQEILKTLSDVRRHPNRRFVAQAFIPHGGRDLRVVVIGTLFYPYWRYQPDPEEFRNNVGRGAFIDYDLDPDLREKGLTCVRLFCEKTGLNLAAFDLLFDRSRPDPVPLLSEVNFMFGRKGIGGSHNFFTYLQQAVDALTKVPGPPSSFATI